MDQLQYIIWCIIFFQTSYFFLLLLQMLPPVRLFRLFLSLIFHRKGSLPSLTSWNRSSDGSLTTTNASTFFNIKISARCLEEDGEDNKVNNKKRNLSPLSSRLTSFICLAFPYLSGHVAPLGMDERLIANSHKIESWWKTEMLALYLHPRLTYC